MGKKFFLSLILILFLSVSIFSQVGPGTFFNKDIGSDRLLIIYNDIVRYFKYLGENSDRVKVSNEGLSTRGNPLYLAFISSKKNIENLDNLISINEKLANPDKISPEEHKRLIEKGKAFVLITGTIHSTEIASSQMMMLQAHKMAVEKDPEKEKILDNVVIMLMPSINPDGNIMVTNWYNKYLNTPFEGGPLPYLYHDYAGHDTNRDFFMLNLKETKIVNAILHKKYFPQIFLDMHQMGTTGPRMFVPPFKDPLNQNLDPLLLRETDIIGSFMALKLQEKGKKGVASGYAFDAYWPGGSKNTAWYKNVVGILTELSSAAIATPIFVDKNELRVRSKGLPEYKKQVNFPDPWPGGWWHLKDIIEYEVIAVDALIEIASKNRKSFLQNFLNSGINSIVKGKADPPYGYMVPADQWDRWSAFEFLRKMKEGGVRIFSLTEDKIIGEKIFKKGSFFLPLNQPYGNYVKVMMEKQKYPEIKHMSGGPIIEPYDSAGWTLPIQMGVKYEDVNIPMENFLLSELTEINIPLEKITGNGNCYILPAASNSSVIAVNRLHKINIPVFRYTGKGDINKGDFVLKGSHLTEDRIQKVIKGTGLNIIKKHINDNSGLIPLKPFKLAIYQPYIPSMDEGWTRWVLDTFEFDYEIFHRKDIRSKGFKKRVDVIIFPDMPRNVIVDGKYKGYWGKYYERMPPRYKGGIGKEGVKNLIDFVSEGGTIILLDSAYELGSRDFQLPFTNILKSVSREKFYCPGSLLKVNIDPDEPVGWGMEKESTLFFSHSPVFRTRIPISAGIDRKVVSRYSDTGSHLISGYLKGGNYLNRAVSSIVFDYFKGNVIVFGGRIQHRGQTFATFKLLFNAIYYSGIK
ncbi:MAG: M14 metallopeptidase family protein [Acidobacteriota bacterium]